MRQVPVFSSYLLIGGGRVARHFAYYFGLESIPFKTWTRSEGYDSLREKAESTSHVLLLISDVAIEPFWREHKFLHDKQTLHFSGALSSQYLPSAHPLMTFADEFYDLETYRRVPFVLEKGRGGADALLPRLKNPVFAIDSHEKTLYHALCVLSGNFTTLLWEKAFSAFSARLGLPKETLLPYLEQTAKNLAAASSGVSVLTGPLVRGDQQTIEKHLNALNGDPFHDVYGAFVSAYKGGTR